jgi:CRP-like cAMP-binding protein/predicted MFS family arabinose efflux permease
MAPPSPDEPAAVDQTAPAPSARGGAHARRGRYRSALRHRDLRLLVASFLVDQVGSWSYLVVISVYVFDRTHSTQWLAGLSICRFAPALLLASYGGVIADRYQRVTVLIVSALASAVLMAGMAVVVAADAPIGLVLVISALTAVVQAPYRPAAGALTPEVVGERDLAAANSVFSALENLVVVAGPGIGGLLLLTGRPVIGVAINAASFVIAAGLTARLRVRSRGGGEAGGSFLQQWMAGFRALGSQRVALAIVVFAALDSAVYGASYVLYVPLSVRLGTGANGYSYLLAGSALGGVLGAFLAERLSRASRLAPVIVGSIWLEALPFLATVPVRSPVLAFALQVLSGVGIIIVDVLAITTLQRDLSRDVLSRVLGVFDTVILSGILLASLGAGILLAHVDVGVTLVVIGAGIPAVALAGAPALLRADRVSAQTAKRLRPLVEVLSTLDLLADADHNTLERLAAAGEELVLPAGSVVIREGDDADALWILLRGELAVQARGSAPAPRELPSVTAPGYVGELGLLHGISRTATVRTRQESVLLRIGSEDFLSALEASRPSASLLSVARTRMSRTPGRDATSHVANGGQGE